MAEWVRGMERGSWPVASKREGEGMANYREPWSFEEIKFGAVGVQGVDTRVLSERVKR